MTVLAHEQFHQLADLVRGSLPPFPVWLSESLAHYYGLKALAHASSGPAVASVRASFIDSTRSINFGLLEINRRHAAKDPTAYPLFHEQGTTFWSEIDGALRTGSAGSHDLDALIPDLFRANVEAGGRLPSAFVAALRIRLGARADELLAKYVGD